MQAQHLKATIPCLRAVQLFFFAFLLLYPKSTRLSNGVKPYKYIFNRWITQHLKASSSSHSVRRTPKEFLLSPFCNSIMSYEQGNMAYPPHGQQQACVAPPPPAGYPQADADKKYPAASGAAETTSRGHRHHHNGGGFWRGW
jgi:hypothetical protein